jgi:hypothetical protein
MTSLVLAERVVQKIFLDGFEIYDPKLPKDDVFEGHICLDLPKSYILTSYSSTDPGSDRKKKLSGFKFYIIYVKYRKTLYH